MRKLGFNEKLKKVVAIVMILAAVFTLAATFMPTSVMAATTGKSCVTGLCCNADRWWKCFFIGYWVFSYNPFTMKCC